MQQQPNDYNVSSVHREAFNFGLWLKTQEINKTKKFNQSMPRPAIDIQLVASFHMMS